MTSTRGRSLVAAGKAMTTRIAVSALIAGAAIVGAGAASAAGCGQLGVGGGYCTGALVVPKAHGPAANAQHTTAKSGRGTAGNLVGGVKTGNNCGFCG